MPTRRDDNWGDYFAQGMNTGVALGNAAIGQEQKDRLLKLQQEESNLKTWKGITEALNLEPGTRRFVVEGILDGAGVERKNPMRQDFMKLIENEDADTMKWVTSLKEGIGPAELKNMPIKFLFDKGNFTKVMELIQKGQDRAETRELMGRAAQVLGGDAETFGLARGALPGETRADPNAVTSGGGAGGAAAPQAAPAQAAQAPAQPAARTGGAAARQPAQTDPMLLKRQHGQLLSLGLQAEAAGNDKAAKYVKGIADQLVKQAWTERFENDHLVRRNAISGEVQNIYQKPEYRKAEKVYHPETGELMGWNVSSSRGGMKFEQAAEYTKNRPIISGTGDVVAYEGTTNTGKKSIINMPELARTEDTPSGGVRQTTNTGKVSFHEPNETFSPVDPNDATGKQMAAQNPNATILRSNRGNYKIEGVQGKPAQLIQNPGEPTRVIQPSGNAVFAPLNTVNSPGTEKAAAATVETLERMSKALEGKRGLLRTVDIADKAAKGGDSAGFYQGLVRTVRDMAAPILGEDNAKTLGLDQLYNALSIKGGLGIAASVSDRPTAAQTALAMASTFSEKLGAEGRTAVKEALLDEIKLDGQLYNRAVAWRKQYGDLYAMGDDGKTFQDKMAEEVAAHQETPAYKKLEERLANLKAPASAVRVGVPIGEMNADELANFKQSDAYKKADAATVRRALARSRQLEAEAKKGNR